jgi:hypothetical protein
MAEESGVRFTYRNGEEENEYSILESLGGGVALLDYDRDGKLDVFLTGGGGFKEKKVLGLKNALFRNEGNGKFRDVTAEAGLDQALHYSHGAFAADFDNDGWTDLLVTGYGRLVLYRNHQGRFVEVTRSAGLGVLTDPGPLHWSSAAGWGDFNGDGWLDLYVAHYVDWSIDKNHPQCPGYVPGVKRDVCGPKQFKPLPHALYINTGKGAFRLAPREAITQRGQATGVLPGKGLGVLVADFNDDGQLDIYIANDTQENYLYLNQGGEKFEEVAIARSVAAGETGKPNGSMGVDTADYDGSGLFSIFVANFQGEVHDLYRNTGRGVFAHASVMAGITAIGQDYVGWGGGFVDIDRDGAEDIVLVNGHVARHPQPPAVPAQKPVIFRNLRKPGERPAGVRFADATPQGGPWFRGLHQARGAALGDLNNDGRTDIIVSRINQPVSLLLNEVGNGHHWLGVQLIGKPNADAIGAKLTLELGNQKLIRQVKGSSSYLSTNDRRIIFGLGPETNVGKLTVRWPSGKVQTWEGLTADRYWKLTEGLEKGE